MPSRPRSALCLHAAAPPPCGCVPPRGVDPCRSASEGTRVLKRGVPFLRLPAPVLSSASWEKWLVLYPERELYEMSSEHLVTRESKDTVKGQKDLRQLADVRTGHRQGNEIQ